MSINRTAKTWTALEDVTAAEMNAEIRDLWVGLQAAWDSWTPTLTGFTLGNGTLVCKYRQEGKTVDIRGKFTAGSTSGFTGNFTLSIPVNAHGDYGSSDAIGVASFTDSSAGATASRTGGTLMIATASTVLLVVDRITPSPTASNTVPWTWANGDTFSFHARYETA